MTTGNDAPFVLVADHAEIGNANASPVSTATGIATSSPQLRVSWNSARTAATPVTPPSTLTGASPA